MKEYILLYRSKLNKYLNIEKCPKSKLLDLNIFISEDYSPYKIDIFTREINLYNTTYIYNNFKEKIMYIGFGEWFVNEDVDGPEYDEYVNYVNENNSCKISVDNFQEFIQNWRTIKKELPSFAIIYRDDKDWVHCQGFQSKEDMEQFIQDAQQIVN
ncbi:hypothetical protein KBC04_00730 [Candidatus Babeliales bacterium]|nr:hypothetical protein [Candidatus Babeliales bacterium]MBP9843384.1 hypothetical protein [Candidatus Babeliales bacterium]